MKPGQSTFDERVSRINSGKTKNASDVVVKTRGLISRSGKARSFHLDMILAGGLAGAVAGTLFSQNIGLLFLLSLDWLTLQGLVLADYKLGAYMAACALGPVGFLFALIFSNRAQRGFQFWIFYCVGVLAANHIEVRYVVEFIIIPGFWEYVGAYTSAADVVNEAAATQPQF
ncbi:hypothetical protein [uncultured Tateyamaria sp.]|uniref:hypothetical protein n=1 Tax=uncultured Tateyamaria sp. TaxID=455651 RepID=UPI002628C249|nr:hypothetical protein [uncultured Tateyamaria sp.]